MTMGGAGMMTGGIGLYGIPQKSSAETMAKGNTYLTLLRRLFVARQGEGRKILRPYDSSGSPADRGLGRADQPLQDRLPRTAVHHPPFL